jgi:radical SAM family uncharacterized protein
LISPIEIQNRLERILLRVQKPGRYVGGELNQVVKSWDDINTRIALVFPDIYDLGLPNLGLAILYETLNNRSDVLAERAYLPWLDMIAVMREAQIPLYSLESKHALADFDMVGISLPYETLYTNTLEILDLAQIPVFSSERRDNDPLIIAGGHSTSNPEPMSEFIDAFVIGDGEGVIHDIVNLVKHHKSLETSRKDLLVSLAAIQGVYVPSLYSPTYLSDGTLAKVERLIPGIPKTIMKHISGVLPPPPTKFIVPSIEVVHNRVSVEIMRGCTRGCRFCQAGMITRPVRERKVDEIVESIQTALDNTGFEEVTLLSLSSSDYSHIIELVEAVSQRFAGKNLIISLPSLRIESTSVDLFEKLKGSRQGGFTLAPEAGTDWMRQIINKPITEQQLLETAGAIYSRGWHKIKLYFMIGHPSETLDDVQAIADLCKAVLAIGRKMIGRRAELHAGVSTFVPKAQTPFQWVACDLVDTIKNKQNLLKKQLSAPGIKFNWTDPHVTMLEAWLSRGDRRLSQVIYLAWKKGAHFDAWQDQFNFPAWHEAFAEVDLDPTFYTNRQHSLDENFPWDHINAGISKTFLKADYRMSLDGTLRSDCREQCYACGILPGYIELRRQNSGPVWKCPEMKLKGITENDVLVIE